VGSSCVNAGGGEDLRNICNRYGQPPELAITNFIIINLIRAFSSHQNFTFFSLFVMREYRGVNLAERGERTY